MNSNMQTNRQTGYPSIDKPWLKYYSEEAINSTITELSIYEYLLENNQDNMQNTAIVYMGNKISYSYLLSMIEKTACAFHSIGVQKGDVVACISPSFPEVIYSLYAVNKLGAITDYFDPRTDNETILQEILVTKPKALLIYDGFLEQFQELVLNSKVPNIIIVSAADSLPIIPKLLLALKKNKHLEQGIAFQSFLDKSKGMGLTQTVSNIADEPAIMEHTGGTTGVPKAVVLTNRNINAVIQQYHLGGGQHSRTESWLSICFPFTAYGLICSQHMPLVYGMTLYPCYSMDIKSITSLLIRKRINHMANTPLAWEEILHSKLAQKTDFSFLINPTVGADTMAVEREEEINDFLKEHNCKYVICKGYGMTEVSSGVSINFSEICNKTGSVGIPFTHTVVSIFDTDTGKELKYGQQGEICIFGPSVMKEYYNNPEATQSVLKEHDDGRIWMHSGDIGHMDEDGFLFIDGRIKRMIINHHGFKIFAPEIERVLSQHSGVDKCCVVGAPDMEYKTGQIAVAFIICKEGQEVKEEDLQKLCAENLPEYYLVSKYVYVKEFPYTSASKVDYRKLEQIAEKE